MGNTTQYTFRLPDDLIAGLDAYAEKLTRETGIAITRADVVKQLLQRGLDAAGGGEAKKPRKK